MSSKLKLLALFGLSVAHICSSLPAGMQQSVVWGCTKGHRRFQQTLRPRGGASQTGTDPAEPLAAVKISFDFLWRGAIAGSIAGTVLEGALYPIDTLKTRVQTGAGNKDLNILSLCSGLLGACLGTVPSAFIFFLAFEPTKVFFAHSPWSVGLPFRHAIAHFIAASAGMLASAIGQVPSDVIKTMVQSGEAPNTLSALAQVLQAKGAPGLYVGTSAWLMVQLPKIQLAFVIFESLKRALKQRLTVDRHLTTAENCVLGVTQGAINGLVLTPVDTIRARLMAQAGHGKQTRRRRTHRQPSAGGVVGVVGAEQPMPAPAEAEEAGGRVAGPRGDEGTGPVRKEGARRRYEGAWDVLWRIIQEEGAGTLFLSAPHRIVWMSLRGAVFWTVLEASRRFFRVPS